MAHGGKPTSSSSFSSEPSLLDFWLGGDTSSLSSCHAPRRIGPPRLAGNKRPCELGMWAQAIAAPGLLLAIRA